MAHDGAFTGPPHIHFDSRAMQPEQAAEFWRDSLSRSWEMDIEAHHAPAFQAEVSMWRLDTLIVGTSIFGPMQTRMRREANIRRDQLDHYRLILLREGQFHCDAAGQEVSLTPGRFVLTDMARPESNASCCSSTILYIPRDLLERALPRPVRLHGASPADACAGLLAHHLSALVQGLPGISGAEAPHLMQATVSLLAASLAQSPDNLEAARPAIESVLLRRARQHIEQNLADENLGTDAICAQLRISRSGLYRLFAGLGGVAEYIKERRLARVHGILSGTHERQNIARLAQDHGFKSASHFSRAFRQQFGYSPSDAASQSPPTANPKIEAPSASRFDRWLGTLSDRSHVGD
ncbi:helix-turn-helix domain-containing protein [Variovorax sp. OV329]|uniref:AraC-like ligand-binding domain-containing protein n=1 Tax=Variovorax sp. OV329 TaxID=1882825 RepID=UPI0008DF7362|nr:helix-turn-helix domain-containing protein [Variovorax sp. OV329]SFM93668.1 AraC-type DNA-binding protein [Variovorax sp. OV329]